jgi:hypothetical protein
MEIPDPIRRQWANAHTTPRRIALICTVVAPSVFRRALHFAAVIVWLPALVVASVAKGYIAWDEHNREQAIKIEFRPSNQPHDPESRS